MLNIIKQFEFGQLFIIKFTLTVQNRTRQNKRAFIFDTTLDVKMSSSEDCGCTTAFVAFFFVLFLLNSEINGARDK